MKKDWGNICKHIWKRSDIRTYKEHVQLHVKQSNLKIEDLKRHFRKEGTIRTSLVIKMFNIVSH